MPIAFTVEHVDTAAVRAAPHAAFFYVNITNTGDSSTHDECLVTWTFTKANGDTITEAPIMFHNPLPYHPGIPDTLRSQRGFTAWYYFESSGTYKATATVTNRAGDTATASSTTLTVLADNRTAKYLDPDATGTGDGSSSTNACTTWDAAMALLGTNIRLKIKSGAALSTSTEKGLVSVNNLLIEVYDGTAPAVLTWEGANTGSAYRVLYGGNCENVIVQDIRVLFPSPPTDRINYGVSLAGFNQACSLFSFMRCSSVNGFTLVGGHSDGTSEGFAAINCDASFCATYGYYVVNWSDVVLLGNSATECDFSHAFRVGRDAGSAYAASKRASIGYNYAETNFGGTREGRYGDSRFYIPYAYIYGNYFENGSVLIDGGTSDYNIVVIEGCYVRNGGGACIFLDHVQFDDFRVSACIFDINNRFLDGTTTNPKGATAAPAISYSSAAADLDGHKFVGLTIMLGDEWDGDELINIDNTAYTLTNFSVKNVLVAYNASTYYKGRCADVPATGVTFSGNNWPTTPGVSEGQFTLGTTTKTMAEWLAAFPDDDTSAVDEDVIRTVNLLPNRRTYPTACTCSVAADLSYKDYFGRPFEAVNGRAGAVTSGKVLTAISGHPV